MGKYRDMQVSDLREDLVKYFDKLEENEPVTLTLSHPRGVWEVQGRELDREAAEEYFQKLWEEEHAKGNASEITIVTEM